MMNELLRRKYYECLQYIFKFDYWHVEAVYERAYAEHIVLKINHWQLPPEEEIVEIGCGMGDIISAISYPKGKKIGYDVDQSVIKGARLAHPFNRFRVGSFCDIVNHRVAVLIAVNFLHIFDEDCVENMFQRFVHYNDVRMIIVDDVESPPYEYKHNYETLFRKLSFEKVYVSHSFEAWGRTRRRILYFERISKLENDSFKISS